ncbi:MAG TPA: GNAT family N-acetyltransferase [Marivita sp.]|nr:GNAT family N-acetyltransferase [Marivita sp.]
MQPCPLVQSDAFARTLQALGTHARVIRGEDPNHPYSCLVQTRQIPILGSVHLISRGPVGFGLDVPRIVRSLDLPGVLVVNTPSPHLRPPGFVQVARPKKVALLPLNEPHLMRSALHQKWRNALRRAERGALKVEVTDYSATGHKWVIERELAQQKQGRYRNWPMVFLDTFAQINPGQVKVFEAYRGKQPVAAMVFLCHAPWVTYHIAVRAENGDTVGAHTLLLWRAMLAFADGGYRCLDLGYLSGSAGLVRFKTRTGAVVQDLGGTWLRFRSASKISPLARKSAA